MYKLVVLAIQRDPSLCPTAKFPENPCLMASACHGYGYTRGFHKGLAAGTGTGTGMAKNTHGLPVQSTTHGYLSHKVSGTSDG
jgi:hypothetical protein